MKMKRFSKLIRFAVALTLMLVVFCSVSFASSNSYLIVEVYDHYDSNVSAILEIELYDYNNNKINYTISPTDQYDSATGRITEYWNNGNWNKSYLNDGNCTYGTNSATIFNYSSNPDTGKWTRFVIVVDSNTQVAKAKVWTGTQRIPQKVSIYNANTYDYLTNIQGRSNTNLTLFGECVISNTTSVVAHEINNSTLPAPSNLTIVADNTKVDLNWNYPIESAIYNVKRSTTSGGPYEIIAEGVNSTTYTDTTATSGAIFYYAVSAVVSGTEGPNSNEVSFVHTIQAPRNLTATPSNTKVDLSWDAVANATSYKVKRSEIAGGPYTTIATGITSTTYTDSTVTNGTTYHYVVSAVVSATESPNSPEASAKPINPDITLEVTSVDKAKVGDIITANIVIHNAINICAEDLKITYDTSILEFISGEGANGIKIYKEDDLAAGIKRYITASLGKENAANGDKILLNFTFKAKTIGEAKIDILTGRVADNATLEMDVANLNCSEKIILIEAKDVNRTNEFTLLDLGIDAWYFGDIAANTDTTKYDTDVVLNGVIDDNDLTEIVNQILKNSNYPAPTGVQ